ncbi:hypothetical protein BS78_03G344600 [Paspalum vaginatum]|nr:hypothetical protein BS78_03G344600 [Paspalum vaginatum]
MMGESGDGHDNGGDLGLHDLFGSTAAAPIDLAAGDDPGGDGGGADAAAASDVPDSSAAPRQRKGKSPAWNDIDPIYKTVGGKKIRIGAVCKWCKTNLSANSDNGTGHLLRHARDCRVKAAAQGKQSQLKFNPDGSIANFVFCPIRARTQMCRLVARLDLPLTLAESPAFEEYIKLAHNPMFKSVSRQTTTRDFVKYFNDRRSSVLDSLQSASSIALTSDIWNGNAKEDYLSVVAHYVTKDWLLEKRIIGLRLIEVSHNAENISERVLSVIADWGCIDKVFSVTLDNASSNVAAMDKLKPALSGYVGTLFLHQRCALHVINLIVKSGLKRFKPWLDAFRTAISFLNASNQRIAAYKSYCVAMGVRPRKFGLDMDVASKLLEFLELFYDATVTLSGVYYPTSPLIMHTILDIAKHLHTYEHDKHIGPAVVPMKKKFLKYWKKLPYLYSFAFILDPRAKLRGFMNILRILSQLGIDDYSGYYIDVRAKLKKMFETYDAKFGAVRLQRPPALTTRPGKRKQNWGMIYADDLGSEFPFPSSASAPNMSRATSASALLQAASSGGLNSLETELTSYLDSDTLQKFDDDFNILSWWHEHKLTYPVLSILARDIISVPVSTISSESAFSLCGRIIEERRRRLSPDMVEMLLCIKDWELGDARMQHNVEDKDMLDAYENLYLDVEPEG